ncbi:MAG: hypothetical protein AMXMBFR33_17570 [Candidatus Xenobia bacterium]
MRAGLRLDVPLEQLREWLAQRLAPWPEVRARLPGFKILARPSLSLQALEDHGAKFRAKPPEEFPAALLCTDGKWSLFLAQGTALEHRRLYARACLHRILGHLAEQDAFGLWLTREGGRRWDLEVADCLPPEETSTETPVCAWHALKFLEDIPRMSEQVPFAPALLPIEPWPHQRKVATELVKRFPERFLLCDEVGLGKTIETGLALRELVHRGLARRILLLVPRSVLPQWREEMQEKFNLFFQEVDPTQPDPWAVGPLVLASSYLVRRKNRMEQLLAAGNWDLVVVDEAHHARGGSTPNRLLELLRRLHRLTRGLWLLTATPLQIEMREVFDLLALLGIRGAFAQEESFLGYFEQLSEGLSVDTLQNQHACLEAYEEHYIKLKEDPMADRYWSRRHGQPKLPLGVRNQVLTPTAQGYDRLTPEERATLRDILLRRTPLHYQMFRNTRDVLRRYYERGLIRQPVPVRRVHPTPITLTSEERRLYDRIEEHLAYLDQAAAELGASATERSRLTFLLDVYRRRLTSSLRGIRLSLERRAKRLTEFLRSRQWTEEEDFELEIELDEEPGAPSESLARLELHSLREFLDDVRGLRADSKLETLRGLVSRVLSGQDRVLIFTQFTDTMDALRDALKQTYPAAELGCYSGRGGQVYLDGSWEVVAKETIKTRFNRPNDLRILICTDAASEGLNFQSCGTLINYDLPWNPMRVEQRIGRIDRIGQRYRELDIHNFYYADSVEARIYEQLGERINLFQAVVGPLQPILAAVEDSIKKLAASRPSERNQLAVSLTQELASKGDELSRKAPPIDPGVDEVDLEPLPAPPDPVRPRDLERLFTSLPRLRERLTPSDEPGIWLWRGQTRVTFDPAVAEAHPEEIHLLSHGDPVFDELVSSALTSLGPPPTGLCRLEATAASQKRGETWLWNGQEWNPVVRLSELLGAQPEEPSESFPGCDKLAASLQGEVARRQSQEERLRQTLRNSDLERAAWALREGVVLSFWLQAGRDESQAEPPTGRIGTLLRSHAGLFAGDEMRDLVGLLGARVHELSLTEGDYAAQRGSSASSLRSRRSHWAASTRTWLDHLSELAVGSETRADTVECRRVAPETVEEKP